MLHNGVRPGLLGEAWVILKYASEFIRVRKLHSCVTERARLSVQRMRGNSLHQGLNEVPFVQIFFTAYNSGFRTTKVIIGRILLE